MISGRLSSLIRMQDPDQSSPSLKDYLLLIQITYRFRLLSQHFAMVQIFRVHGACPLIRRKDASGAGPHMTTRRANYVREHICTYVCITYLRNLLHLHFTGMCFLVTHKRIHTSFHRSLTLPGYGDCLDTLYHLLSVSPFIARKLLARDNAPAIYQRLALARTLVAHKHMLCRAIFRNGSISTLKCT